MHESEISACNSTKTKEMGLTWQSSYTAVGLEQKSVLRVHKSCSRRTGEPGEKGRDPTLQGRVLEHTGTLYQCSQLDLPSMHIVTFKTFHNINQSIGTVSLFITAGKAYLCCVNMETN